MHPFTLLFAIALAAGLATQLWLLHRQARAARAGRDRVPAPFASDVTPAQHARAADYTVARARLVMAERTAGAAWLALLTLAGGIADIDAASTRAGLAGLPRELATVAAVMLLLALAGLPFDAWRTFRIESRFGFNRTTPALFAADALKGLVIGGLLLLPLAALLLWLMRRAGGAWWLWAYGAWAAFSLLLGW